MSKDFERRKVQPARSSKGSCETIRGDLRLERRVDYDVLLECFELKKLLVGRSAY